MARSVKFHSLIRTHSSNQFRANSQPANRMRSVFLWALTLLPAIYAQKTSTTGRCGSTFGLTCQGSSFGSCCSQYNYCGTTSGYCGSGCQSAYGSCNSGSTVPSPVKVSTDGSCGGTTGFNCKGSAYGNCCSQLVHSFGT
jgi:hypothetical protein